MYTQQQKNYLLELISPKYKLTNGHFNEDAVY